MEAVYRRRLAEIAADTTQFGRFAGAYSEPSGHPACRAAIAAALQAEYGWPLEARNVALTAGSQSAFYVLFNLFAGPGTNGARQRVLLPLAPEYIGYSGLNMQDDLIVAHPAVLDELPDGVFKYRLDFEQLEVPADVGAICVSRPTNPSGNVLTTPELERLDLLAQRQRVPLIVDAAYGKPFPGIEFTDSVAFWNDNVVLCLSLSKLGLPGVRTGIVVAHESIIEAITAFNATAALAPPGTGAEIVAPLIASGELSALCNDVVRPFYRARCAFAVDCVARCVRGPAAADPRARGRVLPVAVVPGPADHERGALSPAQAMRRLCDLRASLLSGSRPRLASSRRMRAHQLRAGARDGARGHPAHCGGGRASL